MQLALRLIKHEGQGAAEDALRACERLRLPLIRVAGAAGYASILGRALKLARRRVQGLEQLSVREDGVLDGVEACLSNRQEPKEVRESGAALLSEFLGLLTGLIGEELTMVLVGEAWPLEVDGPSSKRLSESERTHE